MAQKGTLGPRGVAGGGGVPPGLRQVPMRRGPTLVYSWCILAFGR